MWRVRVSTGCSGFLKSVQGELGREDQSLMAVRAKVWGHRFYQKEMPAGMVGHVPSSD